MFYGVPYWAPTDLDLDLQTLCRMNRIHDWEQTPYHRSTKILIHTQTNLIFKVQTILDPALGVELYTAPFMDYRFRQQLGDMFLAVEKNILVCLNPTPNKLWDKLVAWHVLTTSRLFSSGSRPKPWYPSEHHRNERIGPPNAEVLLFWAIPILPWP